MINMIFIYFIFYHYFQQPASDQCALEKYAFEDEGTIQYDVAIPKLDQFTLCAWMRFTNHKGDHSIFTYSGKLVYIEKQNNALVNGNLIIEFFLLFLIDGCEFVCMEWLNLNFFQKPSLCMKSKECY